MNMDKKKLKRLRKQGGFTLTEIMVVVFIIGLLSTAVLINIGGVVGQSRETKARADIQTLSNALEQYSLDMFDYPSEQQGLEALVTAPDDVSEATTYRTGGYIAKLPLDPWGQAYVYERPGDKSGRAFDLYSLGADGAEGGEELNADIGNW
ncbi:MAG: type II secretion system major pseudopilin GspG [Henriciella sp.]|nr:type II secretion system major pseudopilin GspG [Henriciella sp.]